MNCNHCRMNAEKALQQVEGVESATVDLASKEAVVKGSATEEQLKQAIEAIGFELKKA
jgi:copper chaperone CopZ